MKKFSQVFFAVALVTGMLLLGACATIKPASKDDITEVKELGLRFCDAMSRKDLDAAMDCFWDSPDLIVVLWGNTIRGSDAVRASIAQMFEQHETVKLTINESDSVPVGDGIMTVGIATYDLKPKNGPSMQIVEVWTDLTRKIDGRWVYVLDQATILPPQ